MRSLFLNIIELLPKNLIHGKHMHLVLLENRLHLLVTPDLPFVLWDLEIALFDILPDLFDDLRPR
jgi:hypothetical protein